MNDMDHPQPPIGDIHEVRGHPVHVIRSEVRPPVILLHGAGASLRDFTYSLSGRLEEHYSVYAFDRPGLGHTPPLHNHGETPEEQAAVLDATAEQIGIGKAVLVGHSYGAAVALAWALNHPERVGAVVTLGGAVIPFGPEMGLLHRFATSWTGGMVALPLMAALAPRTLISQTIAEVFAPQSPPDDYEDYIQPELSLKAENLRANARQVHDLNEALHQQARRYAAIDVPVEIVHGTEDRIVPFKTNALGLDEALPNGNLVALEGIGHMVHHVAPDETVQAIDRAATRAGLR